MVYERETALTLLMRHARKWLPIAVFSVGVIFVIFHFDVKPVVGDEGVLAMDAWRITQGQVPQRDFFELIPPVAAYAQAAVFYLLGPSVLSLRLLGALYGVTLLVLAWIVARRYVKEPLNVALVLAMLVPFGVAVWPFASHHWLADIFLLAALPALDSAFSACSTTEARSHGEEILGFARWPWRARGQGEKKKVSPRFSLHPLPLTLCFSSPSPCLRGWLLAAFGGMLLALAALTLQDQGGYAIIGVMIATLALPKGARLRLLAALLAGIGAVALIVVLPLAIKAGPMQLITDWILFPITQYHAPEGNRLTFAQKIAQVLSQWDPNALRSSPVYATTIGLASTFVYLLPFLCLISLVLAWRRKWLPIHSLSLLTAVSAAFLLAAWHRWSLMNLIWAAQPPGVVVALALARAKNAKSTVRSGMAGGFSFLLLVCFLVFGIFRLIAVQQPTFFKQIVTPAGSYRTFSPVEASEIQGLVDAISDNVPRSAPLFCYGFDPLINFLTQHPNPTKYNFVLPGGYTSTAQMAQWQATLLSKNVQWGFGPNLPSEPPEPLGTFLRTNYDPVWNNSAFTLWKRHPQAG